MCGITTCPIHERVDVMDEVTDQFGSGRGVTYIDDIAVVTMDNPEYSSPMTALGALLGGPDYKVPGMFVTYAVKVGTGAVGDVSEKDFRAATLHREEFVEHDDPKLDPFRGALDLPEDEKKELSEGMARYLNGVFQAKHTEVCLAVQGGLIK
ncbi:hypothetical protein SEA_TORITOKI_81 [Streptomyces phage ToriToki]|uniref:Uncharacterized protein n=2 Tax=Immanueltrevirus immanuel3 TaxID=2846399 RepID=A0A2H5BML5_9CAUD|nr:hypothetical protein HWB41_gp19 [Streptomyces phage Immanuel3]ATW69429.1 hypothetical protein SEA_IMMANUEL3_79 [Streptomyces phage Immanuel3]AUG87576.1 hypothetical protein SEA_TORITOKI_81 [Streptomyces phage ToriToki]